MESGEKLRALQSSPVGGCPLVSDLLGPEGAAVEERKAACSLQLEDHDPMAGGTQIRLQEWAGKQSPPPHPHWKCRQKLEWRETGSGDRTQGTEFMG